MPRPYLLGIFDRHTLRAPRRNRCQALRRLALQPVLEDMEPRIAPATHVWSGAADNLWSNPANWDGAVQAGDDLVFPVGGSLASANDFAAGTSFHSITIAGPGYSITGNPIGLTGPISATYGSGTSADHLDTALSAGSGAVAVASGGELDLNGALSGSVGITKTGNGVLRLTAANTFNGPTNVNAGQLQLDNSAALGSSASSVTVALFAGVQLDGGVTVGNPLSIGGDGPGFAAGALIGFSGNNTWSGPMTLTANATIRADHNAGLALTNSLADGGAGYDLTLNNDPSGIVSLSGTDALSGKVNVLSGTLADETAVSLDAPTTAVNVSSGATLKLDFVGAGLSVSVQIAGTGVNGLGALRSTKAAYINGPVVLMDNTTIGVDSGLLSLNGPIFSMGSNVLTKVGPGLLEINGPSMFYSPTLVSAGTLQVNGSMPSSIQVGSGAILSGSGFIETVTTTGGTVAPGLFGPSILAVNALQLDPTGRYNAKLWGNVSGSGYDQTVTWSSVNLNGASLNLWLGDGYVPGRGDSLVLIKNNGGNPVSGTFAGLPEGTTISLGAGKSFHITYQGGGGNDVVLNWVQDSTATLSSTSNPAVIGQSLTFTATVSAASGTPTGSVSFHDGASAFGPINLDVNGQASFLFPGGMSLGIHPLSLSYAGDSSDAPSTSSVLSQVAG